MVRWSAGSAMKARFKQLRWRFWRPSQLRYLRVHACRFFGLWWNVTWLYLGSVAVLSAFLADSVTVEPTVIVLCITMILTVQNFKANQGISIFTAALGVVAAFLAVAEKAEVGILDLELWMLVGILVGVPAFTVFWFVFACAFGSRSKRGRRTRRRKPTV